MASRRYSAQKTEGGFTILELTIATLIFSLVLMVVTAGIVYFTTSYIKGTTASATQSTARAIVQEVAESLQFSKNVVALNPRSGWNGYCIDNKRYSFQLGTQLSDGIDPTKHQAMHSLIADVVSGCTSGTNAVNGAAIAGPLKANDPLSGLENAPRELMGAHMRLSQFSITPNAANTGWIVTVRVAYGDDDLFGATAATTNFSAITCQGGAGSQFCGVSELSTFITKRL